MGLNPHNAELRNDSEEKNYYSVNIRIKDLVYRVKGPYVADTVFINEYKNFDVLVGMYHDQVLAPFKTIFKFNAINVTLGLKYLRVSPDHGTSKNIIGRNDEPHQSYKVYKVRKQIWKMIFPKKSLGQNFLIDKNIINKILDLLNIEDQNIIEIGPGTGSLTNEILKRNPKSLLLIEKDNKLFDKLRSNYSKNKMVKIINADILKFNIEKLCDDKTSIVGNLPYNISSQILVKIIKFNKWPPKFKNLTLMFQKELGDKIIGKHSTKDYGRISILTSYRFNVEKNL